jgi:hypothetical protein
MEILSALLMTILGQKMRGLRLGGLIDFPAKMKRFEITFYMPVVMIDREKSKIQSYFLMNLATISLMTMEI